MRLFLYIYRYESKERSKHHPRTIIFKNQNANKNDLERKQKAKAKSADGVLYASTTTHIIRIIVHRFTKLQFEMKILRKLLDIRDDGILFFYSGS